MNASKKGNSPSYEEVKSINSNRELEDEYVEKNDDLVQQNESSKNTKNESDHKNTEKIRKLEEEKKKLENELMTVNHRQRQQENEIN
jgi:hypothetical protein